ncbi:uncharacterized protein LAJ45_08970 [Morchella importuna]|uniref:uncharacterized protein n=1 Tax=Morchella importuna TaxID=1174673 RepID=UPI001E8DCA46|nr:uncharacterized protein LAJ45_08970 [Morchella importuna]KAH8146891.1 hypothetical protein LAJ45_08970 [Morchella importuna]
MAAAYKKRRSLPKDFVSLIFNKEQITLSDCIPVFAELERNPESLSRLFSDEENLLQLLSNFNHYASRISRFFIMFKKHSVNHPVSATHQKPWLGSTFSNELTERILLQLLSDSFSQFMLSNNFLDAFGAVLECCLPHSPRSFEKLAERLFKEKLVFKALISGKTTGGIMKQWVVVLTKVIHDYQALSAWTRTIIEQCDSCMGNHDIDEPKSRWQALDSLLPQLIRALRNKPQGTSNMPWQIRLDPGLIFELQRFGISPPASQRALEDAIFTLERDEAVRMLKAVSGSFPCRYCYKSSTGGEVAELELEQRETCLSLDIGHFSDLLGSGIGMWRVLASGEALEDMQQAYQKGLFGVVERVITQLASGRWEDPPIREPLGGVNSCLYLARYGQDKKSGILWQLDVEFDEAAEALLQLVRIWRIGEVGTIEQAEPHIRLIHKTFSEVRLDAQKQFSVDQASRIAYPNYYGKDSDTLTGTLELDDKSQKQLGESLLRFNRFYSVTQTTFSNVRAGNITAQYPLSLAQEELTIVKDTLNSTLIQGRSGTGKTTCLVYKLFGRYLTSKNLDARSSPRQVLLTRSHVLSNKLKDYTKRLIATHDLKPDPTEGGSDMLSYMLGDDEREVNHTIFTMLADDFPLICTFNYFLKLLENTLRASDRQDFSFHPSAGGPVRDVLSKKAPGRRGLYRKSQVVDFEVFSEQYWGQFSAKLTSGVSPTLAFMEIIGVIKGSACHSIDFQPLTREKYLQEGHRISPIEVDRDLIYNIYERYEKVKRDHGDIDDIDRARDVLKGMAKNRDVRNRIEKAFDEIYIDEIQDQKLLEIMMLLHLVKRPNAAHFAGDTAQSISKDSVFRFENVKDLLYARFSSGKKITPHVHKLYKNYRTHQGILNLATSVMRLLYNNFPNMVDRMKDEEGQFSGPKPVMFVGVGSNVLSRNMFGATNLAADSAQFGADQVIIVRDKAQQDSVRKEIGDFALVLTVLESKGMEFEDVLLLDFFSTSKCSSAWRAAQSRSEDFNSIKHLAFCSELKQLYVAITRAQYRLWFFESDSASAKDILTLWAPDVEVVQNNDNNKHDKLAQLHPGKNANPEIWSRRGYQFIENKNYESALLCFRRANDSNGDKLTRALIVERKAKSHLVRGDEDISEEHFREAARLFQECGQALREASCYEALGEFEHAGDIFATHREFLRAADLYIRAGLFEKGADTFALAGHHNDGAAILAGEQRFDSLVKYLDKHRRNLSAAYQRHYSRLCILLVRRGKISTELRELAASTLNDLEKEEFFREYEMNEQLLKLLVMQCRFTDACSHAVALGNLAEAWRIDGEFRGMAQLPREDRIQVYNYVQVKALHDSLSTHDSLSARANQPFVANYTEPPHRHWLSDTPSIEVFWRDLPQQLDGFWRHQMTYESLVFAEQWMKEVALRAHEFIRSANSLTDLPVESIATAVSVTKELVLNSNIPISLFTLLGVIPCRKQADILIVLQQSLLNDDNSSLVGQKPRVVVTQAIAKLIINCVCRAVTELCEASKDFLYSSTPCLTFQYRGFHNRPGCEMLHRDPMKESEYLAKTKYLLRMASAIRSLLPLYRRGFNNLAPPSFKSEYLGNLRWAMELLLAQITYISAVEQAPEILKAVWEEIAEPNSVYAGVFGGLDDLLFHRLKKDMNTICDLSSMLEQLQIAQNLDSRANYERSLSSSVCRDLKAERCWRTLKTITQSQNRSGIGQESISALDKIIRDADSIDLHVYHSVIALYEKWATYLIYQSNPGDMMLPRAWVSLYRQMLTRTGTPNPASIDSRRQNLLSLVESFCRLVQKINNDEEPFQHKITGRIRAKGQGIHIFARRNVHFLSTCVLNTRSWETPFNSYLQSRLAQVGILVNQTISLPFAMAFWFRDRASFSNFYRAYIDSFNIYSGKDAPLIITDTKNASTLFSTSHPAVSRKSLIELSSPVVLGQTATEKPDYDDTMHLLKDYCNFEPAVITIQTIWRSRYPIIKARRAFFSTSEGVALRFIERICGESVDISVMSVAERVRVRSLLFTVGLQLHLLSEKVDRIYKESRDKAKGMMNEGEMSSIERAQTLFEGLLDLQERIAENINFFSEKNLHSLHQIDSGQLEKRIQEVYKPLPEVYKRLLRIEFSLDLLNPETRRPAAAIAIQRAFRAQRHLLKQRRDFRATEMGKTIAYVKRIVVALSIRDPLDRIGEIQRAWVLFNHVAQLIQKLKQIETNYKKAKRAVRSRINWASSEEKHSARILASQLHNIRETVRKEASFLSEDNWMQLNIPSVELEEKCTETWRVMRTVEHNLFRIMG